jgi:hypothetical protein
MSFTYQLLFVACCRLYYATVHVTLTINEPSTRHLMKANMID